MKRLPTVDELLKKQGSPSNTFHNSLKAVFNTPPLSPSKYPPEWKKVFFKKYPRMEKIILPSPKPFPSISLTKAIINRKSTRSFSKEPISLDYISKLLFFIAGIKKQG